MTRTNADDSFFLDFSSASIRVIRGLLSSSLILFVSIRVHSWLKISRGEDLGLD
jgi:hypothetical protein